VAENRQHPRKPIQLPVGFQIGGGDIVEAWCTDISLGGMYVETDTPAAYGAQLVVYIELPGMKEDAALGATVRWVKKGQGMGLQFGMMGARETHGILTVVSQRNSIV
jgi:Tfp pilus assembly protein PilZ